MMRSAIAIAVGLFGASAPAMAHDNALIAEAELSAGRGTVPPDVLEHGQGQSRIAEFVAINGRVGYDTGPLLVDFGARADLYPADRRFNRYAVGPAVRFDLPLADRSSTRLRVGSSYEYVFADDGRVFDRIRGEVQLIHRHSPEHVSVGRVRYGFRNHSDRRFAGFDQNEWLAELRHTWRPAGAAGSLAGSLIGLKHQAEDDRYSYAGYGFRLLGRGQLGPDLGAVARFSFVKRDYEKPFSAAYLENRSDTQTRATLGLEYAINPQSGLFAEVGYLNNGSNVAERKYAGVIAEIGIRVRR